MNEELESAEQTAWKEIADAIRGYIRKMAELMPAMKPEEVKTFIEATRDAMFMNEYASAFDKEVELRKNRFSLHD